MDTINLISYHVQLPSVVRKTIHLHDVHVGSRVLNMVLRLLSSSPTNDVRTQKLSRFYLFLNIFSVLECFDSKVIRN